MASGWAEADDDLDRPLPPLRGALQARYGRLLTHVSTVDTVRDLDLMRRRVGERMLNYVGTSYGTIVGAVYANVFPGRVRAMALDGVVNPIAWSRPQLKANGGRFLPGGLRFSVGRRDGQDPQCLSRSVREHGHHALRVLRREPRGDATEVHRAAGAAAREPDGRPNDLRAGDLGNGPRSLRGGQLEASSDRPTEAVGARTRGHPHRAAATRSRRWRSPAAKFLPRRPAPSRPSTPSRNSARGWSGRFGPGTMSPAPPGRCAAPTPIGDRRDNRTANPVLVIGNTFDPATPLRGAVAMDRALARARLLTLDGYGHTALLNPSACVNRFESRYFITGPCRPRGPHAGRTRSRSATELHHRLWTEAVAQSCRWSSSAACGGCGFADGSVLLGGVTPVGAVSGAHGCDLVAVELGQVVGGHQ